MFKVAALYHFVPLADIAELRKELTQELTSYGLCGTLLLAPEGINGTLAGPVSGIDQMVQALMTRFGLREHNTKYAYTKERPFQRLKIRTKKEIITFKQPSADPNEHVGTYVTPQDWNKLLEDPEVVLLDTRNRYETSIGSFQGAIDPHIDTFTQFASYVRHQLDSKKHKKVAMFCTGGIRCEKASAFMLAEGFEAVYHLQGGILKYLETVSPQESKWHGECFVFDERVSVDHNLKDQVALTK